MTPIELYELLGKPKLDYLEERVRQTQEELKKPRDEAHRMRLVEQAKMYLSAMQYLEEQEVLKEATTFASRAQTSITALKNTLKDHECVIISHSGAKYLYLASDGTPLEMMGTDSLAIAKEMRLTPELIEGLAKRERGVATKIRKMAKAVQERKERLSGIQSAVAEVSRALLESVELTVKAGEAILTTSARSLDKEYKARARLIAEKRWTEMNPDGTITVDGKGYISFQSVK